MNFSTTGLNILSSSTSQLNATYLSNSLKLSTYIELLKPLYGKSCKKVLISGKKQILTQITSEILSILPVTSSNSLVLKEVLKKSMSLGDGSTTTVLFSALLCRNLIKLVDEGYSRVVVSNVLRKIRTSLELVKVETSLVSIKNSSMIVSGILKDRVLIDLVSKALSHIFDSTDEIFDPNNFSGKDSIEMTCESGQGPILRSLRDTLSIKHFENLEESKLLNELEDRVRIIKVQTGLTKQSTTVPGLVFSGSPLTHKKSGKNLKSAIYSTSVEISRTTEKGILSFTTPDQLLNYSLSEQSNICKITNELCQNSNLVVCSGNVEEEFLHYFDNKGCILFNLPSKHDIRRIRNLLNGTISPMLKAVFLENTGQCENLSLIEMNNCEYTWFQNSSSKVCSIILKNAIPLIVDENERMILKAFKVLMSHYPNFYIIKGCGYFEHAVCNQLNFILKTTDMYELGVIDIFESTLKELVCNTKDSESIYDLLNVRVKSLQYAIDICCVILETQDMFAVRAELDIPRRQDLPRDFLAFSF